MTKAAFLFTGQGFDIGQTYFANRDNTFSSVAQGFLRVFDSPLPEFSNLSVDILQNNEISTAVLLNSALHVIEVLKNKKAQLGIDELDIVAMAGHSVGQFLAMHCANMISLDVLIDLVFTRCKLLNKSVKSTSQKATSLAVILGLQKQALVRLIEEQPTASPIYISSANGNGHTTIAGYCSELPAFMKKAEQAGAFKTLSLNTDGGWHSPFVNSALEPFSNYLDKIDFAPPSVALYENSTGGLMPKQAEQIRQRLLDQLVGAVEWQKTIQQLSDAGVAEAVELTDFNLLSRMGRYSSRTIKFRSVREQLCVA